MATQNKTYKKGDTLIKVGEHGEEYFILQTGCVEVQVYDDDSQEVIATKTLTDGAAFGELALLYNSPRSATITALTDCNCWTLDTKTFKKVILGKAIQDRQIRLAFLDKIKAFEKMDRYKKLRLLDGLEVQKFKSGSTIVREHEKGEYFYIIEQGDVKCTKTNENGEQEVIRHLKNGEYFGEIAIMQSESLRTLTVTAVEDTKLLAMNRETFYQCLGEFTNYLQKEYKV